MPARDRIGAVILLHRHRDLPHHFAGSDIDDGDLGAAVFAFGGFGAGHQQIFFVRRHRRADRAGKTGGDQVGDRLGRIVACGIERGGEVDHGDDAGMAVLKGGRGRGRRAPGVIDHIGEAARRRDDDIDRLAAGDGVGMPSPSASTSGVTRMRLMMACGVASLFGSSAREDRRRRRRCPNGR